MRSGRLDTPFYHRFRTTKVEKLVLIYVLGYNATFNTFGMEA